MTEEKRTELETLIDEFGEIKTEVDEKKKICDSFNKSIKEIMITENLNEWKTDSYTATYTEKHNTTVDEDRLFLVLSEAWSAENGSIQCPYIKTIQVVDDKALEQAIYEGKINPDLLVKIKECSTTKTTPTLTVKRKGGKKHE